MTSPAPSATSRGRWSRSISPSAWVSFEKLTQQGLWFALFAVLGPILGPRPYGLFALAMVLVGFCEIVLAEAAAEALLSLKTVTREHIGAANLANIAAGLIAGAAAAMLGLPIAMMMHDGSIAQVFLALSPLPVLSSLVATPTALLKRDMNFKQFALRSIIGLTIGGALGIVAALAGLGVWALVIQIIAQRAAEVVVLWIGAPNAFGLRWSRRCFDDLRGCALNVLTARTWTWVAAQSPRLIVGWILGPTVLGLFTLATRISDVLLQVTLTPAAQIARLEMRRYLEDRSSLQQAFERLIADMGLVAFPIAIGMAAIAPTLCAQWLGPRWTGAGTSAAIMALTICPWTYFYCSTAVMMGLNLSKLDVSIQAVLAISTTVVTLVAAPFGLNAVCWALLLRLMVFAVMPLTALRRSTGVNVAKLLKASVGGLFAAGAMGTGVMLITPIATHTYGRAIALPLLVAAGVVLYGLVICVAAPGDLRRLLSALHRLRVGGQTPATAV